MLDAAAPIQFVINAGAGSSDADTTREVIESVLQAEGRRGDLHFCTPSVARLKPERGWSRRGSEVARRLVAHHRGRAVAAVSTTSGHWLPAHVITRSARSNSACGTLRPRDLAVFILITRSNLASCSTGRSTGFAPLSNRLTKRDIPLYNS